MRNIPVTLSSPSLVSEQPSTSQGRLSAASSTSSLETPENYIIQSKHSKHFNKDMAELINVEKSLCQREMTVEEAQNKLAAACDNCATEHERNVLWREIVGSNLKLLVRALLMKPDMVNAYVNKTGMLGEAFIVAHMKDTDILKIVVESGHFDINAAVETTHHLWLHEARDKCVAEILLDAGADPKTTDHKGDTALHRAVTYRHINNTAEVLINAPGAPLNAIDAKGRTALFLATDRGYGNLMQALLDKGADPNIGRNLDPDFDPDSYGKPPLHMSARFTRDMCERYDSTGFHYSLEDRLGHVEMLVKYDADVDVIDRDGYTPLMYALSSGNVAIVAKLVKSGADVNREFSLRRGRGNVSRDRLTPLHYAVILMQPRLVNMMLYAGANLDARDEDGFNVLYNARQIMDEPDFYERVIELYGRPPLQPPFHHDRPDPDKCYEIVREAGDSYLSLQNIVRQYIRNRKKKSEFDQLGKVLPRQIMEYIMCEGIDSFLVEKTPAPALLLQALDPADAG